MRAESDTSAMPAEMHQAIQALRAKFLDEVETRILHLEGALIEVRHGSDVLAAARAISASAHKIAGLAPTLGFHDVGEAARNTEERWNEAIVQNCSTPSLQPAIIAVEALMDKLEETFVS